MSNPAFLFTDVVEKLKTTVHEGRSFDAAQVKLVGLDDIRAAAGENWDAIKERVRANSLGFLQGCLGQEDIVIPAGDGFLVLYAEAPARDLTRESAVLQDALNAFYIGEEGMERLRSKVKGVSVDAQNVHAVLAFDGEDLHDAADAPPPLAVEGPAEPIAHHLRFAPVWSVAQEAIATYLLTPAYADERGALQLGYDPAYRRRARHAYEDYLALDLRLLDAAIQEGQAAFAAGRKCLVSYSVHATTLRARAPRAKYLSALARMPSHLRKYLSPRIAEIEPGVPLITLSEWVGVLRGAARRVTIELHPSEPNLLDLRTSGIAGVECFLPIADPITPAQRRDFASLIGRWARALHGQGLHFNICHVVDPALLEVGRRAGADFIGSERVWPSVGAPMGVVPFAASNIAAAFAGAAPSRP
jgi:hypothetical protein